MKYTFTRFVRLLLILGFVFISIPGFTQTIKYVQTGEEFSGPFASWKNVKTVFGAKGDGVTDDAPAINAALLALHNSSKDSFNVLYFPAGTYLIDDSLYNPGGDYADMAIIGEDPATTIINWNGASGGDMFVLDGWYLRVSRLTFEGNNNALRGIYKTGTFSTHCEFSDLVFKDFSSGVGLDFSAPTNGQAEDAIVRCHFINCSSGIASCNWNSLDQWVWWCLFQNCKMAINQCTGYFQIYDNVFLNSSVYDIGSSPYKSVISGNTSINSKCFYNSNGTGSLLRGNKIYSNVDSFYTVGGSSVVMLDNTIRAPKDAYAITRTGSYNMFIGNTISKISSQWYNWPIQPPYDEFDHGLGSNFNIGKQVEKAIDGNAATSFATTAQPAGVKWNCPVGTKRKMVKYTVSAPASGGGDSPVNFQLLGSNNWGYTWNILDYETGQSFTGGGNPVTYNIKNTTDYSMYQLQSVNTWQEDDFGGRSIVNTGAESGTYCEQMVLSQFPRTVFQNLLNLHADTLYNVSGWMKSNIVVNNAYILVFWYDTIYPLNPTTGSAINYIRVDTIGITTGTTGWTQYSKTLTAPAGALSAQLFLADDWLATSSGTVWFDNFSFASKKLPAKNLLIDPGFENGPDPEWWEINELTLLDSVGSDLTKDPNGFVSGADESWGQYYPLDNSVVDTSAIVVPDTITLPGAPQNMQRKIFEVAQGTGNDANEIQSKIDSAALEPVGTKPVVHIPFGFYTVKTTLTVPANSDMQIIGDGLGTGTNATTSLAWGGNQTGPLMLCLGPSRVTIKDLLLNVPYASYDGPEALEIEDADQVGGRIFGDQFNAGGPQWTQPCDIGIWSNGIENSDITMICFYPGFGNTAMVQATGGTVLSSGGNTNGQISLLAGATGDCQNLFNVTDGGRIDAEGMWNEGDWARTSGLINLSNTSGKLSIACMSWNLLQLTYPMINTNNFSGTFTLLLNHINQEPQAYMPMTGDGANCNILGAYNDWGQSNKIGGTTDSTWRDSTLPAANTDFIGNTSFNGALNVVVSKVQNILPDSNSILNELSQLREVRTDPPNDMPTGVTDVKLFRVAAWGTQGHVAAEFNTVGSPTGIKTVPPPDQYLVFLYPNVVQQFYTVSYQLPQAGTVSFTVYDILGRQISKQFIEQSKGYNKQQFSVGGLSAGTYYLKFQFGNISVTKKFIVMR